MNLVYYLIFSLAVFMLAIIGYKKFRSTTLYALAIGGIVNANFFHSGNYPIKIFGLDFGIDSIIYTLFAFCVIIMLIKEDKKSAYLLGFSSVIAIMFSALMQLVSSLLSQGNSWDVWATFLTFCASSIASTIAIIVAIEITQHIKQRFNNYIQLIIGILIILAVNTIIYCPLAILINNTPANLWTMLLTNSIGKIISLIIGLFTLFLFNKIDKTPTITKN